ncbi:MAG: copper amine oxidase N-terminal domain-containing protein [Clostridia bacterium]|nr:copper amine oxidase N-terminal domain-containing protein [Clostridia bacterium]
MEIILTIGSDKATVNGVQKALDCPAEIVSARTFVPLRFVGEMLGARR